MAASLLGLWGLLGMACALPHGSLDWQGFQVSFEVGGACRRGSRGWIGFLFADFAEVGIGVDTGAVAVAEEEGEGVAADDFPAGDADRGVVHFGAAAELFAEQVAFPLVFGAWREGAQAGHGDEVFGAIGPCEDHGIANGGDVFESGVGGHV